MTKKESQNGSTMGISHYTINEKVSKTRLIVGVSFLMISNMPIMPQDLFTREIHQYFGFPFKRVKITFDLSCVAISLVLALVVEKRVIGIGAGTIVNALIVGKCVDRVKKFLVDKILAFT